MPLFKILLKHVLTIIAISMAVIMSLAIYFLVLFSHYSLLLIIGACIAVFILKFKFRLTSRTKNLMMMCLSVLTGLFIAEICLRFFGINDTNTEANHSGKYHSQFNYYEHKLLEHQLPNNYVVQENTEFTHFIHTNSLRLNDKEWTLISDSICRIACLGDSYTEGFGATGDSSYPRILQTMLSSTEVMRCGMQGCDPLYEYAVLKEKLLPYHLDIVTLTINDTDIDDILTKGGFERFRPDGIVGTHPGPWWEIFYEHSYLVRLVVRNGLRRDYLLMTRKQHLAETEKAKKILEICLDRFHKLCVENNIRCIFIFHPSASEAKKAYMDCESIMKYAQGQGYEAIDVLSYFQGHGMNSENTTKYYWKVDGHHNNAGYALLAKAIGNYLKGQRGL